MYVRVKTIPEIVIGRGNSVVEPVATLKDQSGGICNIINDDHCYVLYLNDSNGLYGPSYHIFKEAFDVLKELPDLGTPIDEPPLPSDEAREKI